ncbi:MAG: hypothetical protein QM653_17135 [Dysgonomonas sp.]|uniref:hypothetical protein n=1 Tax=Dysgonomonas sp. TaxID=1891233 RepID=UPI0039E3AF0E
MNITAKVNYKKVSLGWEHTQPFEKERMPVLIGSEDMKRSYLPKINRLLAKIR